MAPRLSRSWFQLSAAKEMYIRQRGWFTTAKTARRELGGQWVTGDAEWPKPAHGQWAGAMSTLRWRWVLALLVYGYPISHHGWAAWLWIMDMEL
jgi:hypothetical protein